MLNLKGITKVYKVASGDVQALKGIDISFRKNEFVSILGPSGCGKTTTLNIIGGLDKYTSGDLVIAGKSTKNFTDREWDVYRNHRIGFVFQSYNLIPHQTVLGNVELALTISGVSKEERVRRAKSALDKVGLKGEYFKHPNQLSGGQCQRVAIARALVNEPDILLADEPTGALDSKTSVQIMDLIKEISKEKLVIMVTHNAEIAEQYSTRIVRLIDGEIIEDTNPYSEEEENKEIALINAKKDKKSKKNKAKMSAWTAFKLSMRNLFTKKGRTILTSFAGSIGIIGISLILAVSQGMTTYINHVQQTTLSSYPIVLEEQSIDLTSLMESFMGVGKDSLEHEKDAVYKAPIIFEMVNALSKVENNQNDLKSFKSYLEQEISDENSKLNNAISGIQYGYDLDFEIYTKNVQNEVVKSDTAELMQDMLTKFMLGSSNSGSSSQIMNSGGNMFTSMMTSSGMWQEILSEKDGGTVNKIIKEQYDLVYGDWPTAYNEVVLVLNKNSELDDLTLYALGLIGQDKIDEILDASINGKELPVTEQKWSYKEICEQREYRVVLPYDRYYYAEDPKTWKDKTEILGLNGLYGIGTPLKIKGVIIENADAENHMLTGNICYTYKLTEHIINEAKNSGVVDTQLENPNIDILTGLPFKSSAGSLTDEQKKADFLTYVDSLSVDEKAQVYIDIKCIVSDEDLLSMAQEMMDKSYSTIEAQKELIATSLSAQLGMSKEEILISLEKISDEQITDTATTICKAMCLAINTQKVTATLKAQYDNVQLATLLDTEKLNYTNEQFSTYYDNVLEFSESTYENNLKIFGCLDLASPQTISIYASLFEDKDIILEAINEYNKGVDETKTIKYTDYMGIMMSSINIIIDAITYVLIAFVAISLVVSSIMIAVIVLISVQERTKEIGVLRSIGASKKDVSNLFNAETIIIGFASGLLGVLITYFLCVPINIILQTLTGIPNLRAILPITAAVILVAISVILNFIAGLIPSRSAAKKDPVVALRTE